MSRVALFFLALGMLHAKGLPKGFVDLKEAIPSIVLEIRYAGEDNFIGRSIDGYKAPTAILTNSAAKALGRVQQALAPFGLGLKVFDAYRPQKAVDHFMRWGEALEDTKMKDRYYPTVDKKNLFKEGYIATKSGHSRGSTVDLTIIDLASHEELDMGSSFDYFGQPSWVIYDQITPQQRANRMLLHTLMVEHGFRSLKEEWWHFTLRDEPYRDRYFDFDLE